ncbi:MAG: AbrB/MazE/SpoVT family DNA-binding domain-containing protein [Thermoanaerobaculales bacterium]|nr:AbrB/MazE/SpoVT family DNA-binding domain-containing protein [Thermoanaerobaculales bacterium]
MITKVQRWGNSQGLRLNKQVLEEAHISVGDEVDLAVRGGVILLRPVRRVRGGQDLKKLVAQIPKDYKPGEIDWGQC